MFLGWITWLRGWLSNIQKIQIPIIHLTRSRCLIPFWFLMYFYMTYSSYKVGRIHWRTQLTKKNRCWEKSKSWTKGIFTPNFKLVSQSERLLLQRCIICSTPWLPDALQEARLSPPRGLASLCSKLSSIQMLACVEQADRLCYHQKVR